MEKKIGKVSTVAECQDCGWRTEDYKNGQAIAAIHAKKHKHIVMGEVVLAFEYNGKVSNANHL